MMKRSKKGFTLAELMIVIAIIAILVGIMLPVFGAQLDKARAAADLANVRAEYANLVSDAMMGEEDLTNVVDEVKIDITKLAKAMQYSKSKVTYDPTTATAPKIQVDHGDYNGSFVIDTDVKVWAGSGSAFTGITTYKQDGTKVGS